MITKKRRNTLKIMALIQKNRWNYSRFLSETHKMHSNCSTMKLMNSNETKKQNVIAFQYEIPTNEQKKTSKAMNKDIVN